MAIQQIDTQLATDFIVNQLNTQQQTLFEIDHLPESTIAFADVTDDVVTGALVLKVFGNTAHISLLAVSSEYRGHGIGHNLVDATIKTSKSLNLLHIWSACRHTVCWHYQILSTNDAVVADESQFTSLF